MNNLQKNEAIEATDDCSAGLTSLHGFALAQRAGMLLSQSSLVPKEYQGNLPNCVIALNMATRLGADPLMVMQNLVVVNGRPTWSSQFLIATVNTCGRFTALRYEFFGERDTDSWGCRAFAIEKATNEKLVGTDVTIAIAKKEGWYGKSGSKWPSIPQQMLMYRAGSWWTRVYAPELSMGLHTADEASDIIDMNPDGSIASVTSSRMPPRQSLNVTNVTEIAKQPKDRKIPPRAAKHIDEVEEKQEEESPSQPDPIHPAHDADTGEIITDPYDDEARSVADDGSRRLRLWFAKQGDNNISRLESIMSELHQRAQAADERNGGK